MGVKGENYGEICNTVDNKNTVRRGSAKGFWTLPIVIHGLLKLIGECLEVGPPQTSN